MRFTRFHKLEEGTTEIQGTPEIRLNLLEAGRRPVRSQIPLRYPGRRQVRTSTCSVESCRDSSNLVADWFEAKFHYTILVADWFEPASNLSATSFEPACELDSVMEFGFKRACTITG